MHREEMLMVRTIILDFFVDSIIIWILIGCWFHVNGLISWNSNLNCNYQYYWYYSTAYWIKSSFHLPHHALPVLYGMAIWILTSDSDNMTDLIIILDVMIMWSSSLYHITPFLSLSSLWYECIWKWGLPPLQSKWQFHRKRNICCPNWLTIEIREALLSQKPKWFIQISWWIAILRQ